MRTKSMYKCPVCFYHRQEFQCDSRFRLEAHLEYSHAQSDLVRYMIKSIIKERIADE